MYNWEILTKETINEKRKKGVEGDNKQSSKPFDPGAQ